MPNDQYQRNGATELRGSAEGEVTQKRKKERGSCADGGTCLFSTSHTDTHTHTDKATKVISVWFVRTLRAKGERRTRRRRRRKEHKRREVETETEMEQSTVAPLDIALVSFVVVEKWEGERL